MKNWIHILAAAALASLLLLLGGCTTARLEKPAGADLAGIMARAAATDFGQDDRAFKELELLVAAKPDPARRRELERALAGLAVDPQATMAARLQAVRHLRVVGTAASVPGLAPLLEDPATAYLGRAVLEAIPGTEAEAALLSAAAQAQGILRAELVQSLGERPSGSPEGVAALAGYLQDASPEVRAAAARSLGRLGGSAAWGALTSGPGAMEPARVEAALQVASGVEAGLAVAFYQKILASPDVAAPWRQAAFQGLLTREPDRALARVADLFPVGPEDLQSVALQSIPGLADSQTTPRLARVLPACREPVQTFLVEALALRGDPAAVPELLTVARDSQGEASLAALRALGTLPGNPETLEFLMTQALTGNKDRRAAALEAAARLRGDGVDAAVLAAAQAVGAPGRVDSIRLTGARAIAEATDTLMGRREEADLEIRLAALEALEFIGRAGDVPALIAWALETEERKEAVQGLSTVGAVAQRTGQVEEAAAGLIAREGAAGAGKAGLVVAFLPRLGGATALAELSRQASGSDLEAARAAARSMGQWQDPAALENLVRVAETQTDAEVDRAAVQGFITLSKKRGGPNEKERAVLRERLQVAVQDPATLSLLEKAEDR